MNKGEPCPICARDEVFLGICALCGFRYHKGNTPMQELNTQNIPDYINPIVAYRGWRINEGGLLRAMISDDFWIPLELKTAECRNTSIYINKHTGVCPQENCVCGIYAFKERNPELQHKLQLSEKFISGAEL
jgi:hypothetical protein